MDIDIINQAWPYVKNYMDWYLNPELNTSVSEQAEEEGKSFDEVVRYNLFEDPDTWTDPEVGIIYTGWYEDPDLYEYLSYYDEDDPGYSELIDSLVTRAKDYVSNILDGKDMNEEIITEAKSKNPEELEIETETIKSDLEDFGPEGFYAVSFDRFSREFPEFTNAVVKTFLLDMGILNEDELNDIDNLGDEDGNYWSTGRLIFPSDWEALIDGAERLYTFRKDKGIQWEKIYKSHYKSYNESLTAIDDAKEED